LNASVKAPPSNNSASDSPARFSLLVSLLKGLVWLVSKLPRGARRGFARILGFLYANVVRQRRGDALANLRRAFPDRPESELKAVRRQMYDHLAYTLLDSLHIAAVEPDAFREEYEWVDRHHLDEALARGRGCIAATGHLGSWEVLGTVGQLEGLSMFVVVKDVKPPALNRYLNRIRSRFGTEVLPRKGSYRRCVTAIKREKKVMGFLIDQNTTKESGIFVDFFGQPACTTPGAAFIAAQTQCPIVPVAAVRQPCGRHQIHCLPLIEPPADREPDNIQRTTQEMTTAFESLVRAHPEQWTWIHRRWRTKLPAAGSSKVEG